MIESQEFLAQIRWAFAESLPETTEEVVWGDISNIFEDRRLELELTYDALAHLIGVAQGTVSKYLSGQIDIKTRRMIRLMFVLGLRFQDLNPRGFMTANLRGYLGAVRFVQNVLEPGYRGQINEGELISLAAVCTVLASGFRDRERGPIKVTDEIARQAFKTAHNWFAGISVPSMDEKSLERLYREWGPAWMWCLRAIRGEERAES